LTDSIDFPTGSSFQVKWQGGEDAFVSKLISPPANRYHTDFNGNNSDDPGLWAVKGTTRVYFGGVGDIPITK
jgi:hypothetical protein